MIKLTKYIRINVLTIILFAVCAALHTLPLLCVTYAVMLIHETAHALAAVCIGLKISYITLYPFGVNLKLKNKIVYSLAEEIILYISGPLSNVIIALIVMLIYSFYPSDILKFLYVCNITLFAVNMLPAMPLDGGIILKKILSRAIGEERAVLMMKIFSAACCGALLLIGIRVLYETRFNFSVLLFALMMTGNIFTQSEKYDAELVRELMFYRRKKKNKVKHIIVTDTLEKREIAKKLDKRAYNVIYITDASGKILDILTEKQLINSLTDGET